MVWNRVSHATVGHLRTKTPAPPVKLAPLANILSDKPLHAPIALLGNIQTRKDPALANLVLLAWMEQGAWGPYRLIIVLKFAALGSLAFKALSLASLAVLATFLSLPLPRCVYHAHSANFSHLEIKVPVWRVVEIKVLL